MQFFSDILLIYFLNDGFDTFFAVNNILSFFLLHIIFYPGT